MGDGKVMLSGLLTNENQDIKAIYTLINNENGKVMLSGVHWVK